MLLLFADTSEKELIMFVGAPSVQIIWPSQTENKYFGAYVLWRPPAGNDGGAYLLKASFINIKNVNCCGKYFTKTIQARASVQKNTVSGITRWNKLELLTHFHHYFHRIWPINRHATTLSCSFLTVRSSYFNITNSDGWSDTTLDSFIQGNIQRKHCAKRWPHTSPRERITVCVLRHSVNFLLTWFII